MTGFGINTMVSHASKLGNIERWNVTEMINWANSFPRATLMDTSAGQMMNIMVFMVLDKFVDWSTGNVTFNSDEFIEILEFAATFGNTDEWNPDRIPTYEALTTGQNLMMTHTIMDLTYMQLIDALFDGEARFIGYPSETGSGILMTQTGAAGINSRSNNKDGAFAFINYLMSDAYQSSENRGVIPIKRSAIDEMIRAKTPGPGQDMVPMGYDDFFDMFDLARNRDYVDRFNDLISRASGIMIYDEQMNNIIMEETGSVFAGQKSARDAAEIIQNRIQLYVNENRN